MNEISRRSFCAAAGLGLVALKTGCGRAVTPDAGAPGRRDAGHGQNGAGGPDLSTAPRADAASADAASAGPVEDAGVDDEGAPANEGACPAMGKGIVNAGPSSTVTMNQPRTIVGIPYAFYVCRDKDGLYVVDALCTHSGCPVLIVGSKLVCPCHAATFDLDGGNPTFPAPAPLPHLAACLAPNGDVIVDTTKFVPHAVRI